MTREDIIRMALEAGFDSAHLTRFAELVFEQGRQEGMKQERALWELSKLGQEIEAQSEQVGEHECRKLLYGFMLDCNAVGLEQAGKNLHRGLKEKNT